MIVRRLFSDFELPKISIHKFNAATDRALLAGMVESAFHLVTCH